jgi:hypothetical protein
LKNPLCKELIDIVSNVFYWEKTLHLKVLGNFNNSELKNNKMMSESRKEYNWTM